MRAKQFIFESAVDELEKELPNLKKVDYDSIDKLMTKVSSRHGIDGKKLHDLFVEKHKHTPDYWIKKYKEKLNEAGLDTVANIANTIPSFISRAIQVGAKEIRDTGTLAKILTKWIGTGQLSPAETKFAKAQLADIAKIAGGLILTKATMGMAGSAAHAAGLTTAAAHGAGHHGAAATAGHILKDMGTDLSLDVGAEALEAKFGVDFLHTVLHGLKTSTSHKIDKEIAQGHQQANPELDKRVQQQYRDTMAYAGGMGEGKTPKKKLSEDGNVTIDDKQVEQFVHWCIKRLHIKQPYPHITLSDDTEKARAGTHTGVHTEDGHIWVYTGNRNLIDIFRTIFHELVHHRQSQKGMIGPDDSYPGSPIEAMADMLAGKYIKIYGKHHPEIFQ